MGEKEGFHRLCLNDMKTMQKEREFQRMAEQAMRKLEQQITEEAEKLAQELVDSGLDVDNFEIVTDTKWQGEELIVHLNVIQKGKTLKFNLKGDE